MGPLDVKDSAACLSEDGFVHLRDVFRPADLDALAGELTSLIESVDRRELQHLGGEEVLEINRALSARPALRTQPVFLRCREIASSWLDHPARCSFDHVIFKGPSERSVIDWHQDQAYQRLDRDMQSIHFWIPLQDTTVQNGGLEYVRGSHRDGLLPHCRSKGSEALWVVGSPQWHVTAPEVRKGDCAAHLPLTLHRSRANLSREWRRAWILHFSPHGKWDVLRPANLRRHAKNFLGRHR